MSIRRWLRVALALTLLHLPVLAGCSADADLYKHSTKIVLPNQVTSATRVAEWLDWWLDLLLEDSHRNQIVVVARNNSPHIRIFDGDGEVVVNTVKTNLTTQDELIADLKKQIESVRPLTTQDKLIADLKKQIESVRPPHVLTKSAEGRSTTAAVVPLSLKWWRNKVVRMAAAAGRRVGRGRLR